MASSAKSRWKGAHDKWPGHVEEARNSEGHVHRGYHLLEFRVAAELLRIGPVDSADDYWGPSAFQLLLVVSEYMSALLEYLDWFFPNFGWDHHRQAIILSKRFLQPRSPHQYLEAAIDPQLRTAWTSFTYCFFHGTQHMPQQPQGDASGVHQAARDWLTRLVGEQGFEPEGPIVASLQAWLQGMRPRLAQIFPQVDWNSPLRVVWPDPDSSIRACEKRGAIKRQQEEDYPVRYPLRVTQGRPKFNHMKVEARDGFKVGIPNSKNPPALGFLAVSDVMCAFKQAAQHWSAEPPASAAYVSQQEVVQSFISNVLREARGPLSGDADHMAFRYLDYLACCVVGWERALNYLRSWVTETAPWGPLSLALPGAMPALPLGAGLGMGMAGMFPGGGGMGLQQQQLQGALPQQVASTSNGAGPAGGGGGLGRGPGGLSRHPTRTRPSPFMPAKRAPGEPAATPPPQMPPPDPPQLPWQGNGAAAQQQGTIEDGAKAMSLGGLSSMQVGGLSSMQVGGLSSMQDLVDSLPADNDLSWSAIAEMMGGGAGPQRGGGAGLNGGGPGPPPIDIPPGGPHHPPPTMAQGTITTGSPGTDPALSAFGMQQQQQMMLQPHQQGMPYGGQQGMWGQMPAGGGGGGRGHMRRLSHGQIVTGADSPAENGSPVIRSSPSPPPMLPEAGGGAGGPFWGWPGGPGGPGPAQQGWPATGGGGGGVGGGDGVGGGGGGLVRGRSQAPDEPAAKRHAVHTGGITVTAKRDNSLNHPLNSLSHYLTEREMHSGGSSAAARAAAAAAAAHIRYSQLSLRDHPDTGALADLGELLGTAAGPSYRALEMPPADAAALRRRLGQQLLGTVRVWAASSDSEYAYHEVVRQVAALLEQGAPVEYAVDGPPLPNLRPSPGVPFPPAHMPAAQAADPTASYTALHWACLRGHVALADLLLKHGANSQQPDRAGVTPAGANPSFAPILAERAVLAQRMMDPRYGGSILARATLERPAPDCFKWVNLPRGPDEEPQAGPSGPSAQRMQHPANRQGNGGGGGGAGEATDAANGAAATSSSILPTAGPSNSSNDDPSERDSALNEPHMSRHVGLLGQPAASGSGRPPSPYASQQYVRLLQVLGFEGHELAALQDGLMEVTRVGDMRRAAPMALVRLRPAGGYSAQELRDMILGRAIKPEVATRLEAATTGQAGVPGRWTLEVYYSREQMALRRTVESAYARGWQVRPNGQVPCFLDAQRLYIKDAYGNYRHVPHAVAVSKRGGGGAGAAVAPTHSREAYRWFEELEEHTPVNRTCLIVRGVPLSPKPAGGGGGSGAMSEAALAAADREWLQGCVVPQLLQIVGLHPTAVVEVSRMTLPHPTGPSGDERGGATPLPVIRLRFRDEATRKMAHKLLSEIMIDGNGWPGPRPGDPMVAAALQERGWGSWTFHHALTLAQLEYVRDTQPMLRRVAQAIEADPWKRERLRAYRLTGGRIWLQGRAEAAALLDSSSEHQLHGMQQGWGSPVPLYDPLFILDHYLRDRERSKQRRLRHAQKHQQQQLLRQRQQQQQQQFQNPRFVNLGGQVQADSMAAGGSASGGSGSAGGPPATPEQVLFGLLQRADQAAGQLALREPQRAPHVILTMLQQLTYLNPINLHAAVQQNPPPVSPQQSQQPQMQPVPPQQQPQDPAMVFLGSQGHVGQAQGQGGMPPSRFAGTTTSSGAGVDRHPSMQQQQMAAASERQQLQQLQQQINAERAASLQQQISSERGHSVQQQVSAERGHSMQLQQQHIEIQPAGHMNLAGSPNVVINSPQQHEPAAGTPHTAAAAPGVIIHAPHGQQGSGGSGGFPPPGRRSLLAQQLHHQHHQQHSDRAGAAGGATAQGMHPTPMGLDASAASPTPGVQGGHGPGPEAARMMMMMAPPGIPGGGHMQPGAADPGQRAGAAPPPTQVMGPAGVSPPGAGDWGFGNSLGSTMLLPSARLSSGLFNSLDANFLDT